MDNRLKNRKGTATDVLYMIIIIFAAAIMFLASTNVYTQFVNKAVNNTQINSSTSAVNSLKATKDLQSRYDYVILGLLVGFILAIIISSWYVAGNPIFTFIYFIALVIVIVVSIVLSYAWNQLSTKPTFTTALTYFPITDFILNNLAVFTTVIGFIAMIVLFAKPYLQGQQ